jgi:putative ABC transport system permease protein
MKYLPLLWKSLWRRKIRTIFTLASIFVAFLLFGILMTIRAAFGVGVQLAGLDRLILIHKVSLIQPLPIA